MTSLLGASRVKSCFTGLPVASALKPMRMVLAGRKMVPPPPLWLDSCRAARRVQVAGLPAACGSVLSHLPSPGVASGQSQTLLTVKSGVATAGAASAPRPAAIRATLTIRGRLGEQLSSRMGAPCFRLDRHKGRYERHRWPAGGPGGPSRPSPPDQGTMTRYWLLMAGPELPPRETTSPAAKNLRNSWKSRTGLSLSVMLPAAADQV